MPERETNKELRKKISFLLSRLNSESGEDAKETEKEIAYYQDELDRRKSE